MIVVELIGDIVVAAALLAGSLLSLIAAAGLHRLPDVFARMHAATKPATLGLLLVIGALATRTEDAGDVAKLVLVIGLQFLTAPVGAHMIGRAAHQAGTEISPDTIIDELADRRRAEH